MDNNHCSGCSDSQTSNESYWAMIELLNGAHERERRRNWVERIVLIAVILITNVCWLLFFFQFDYESYSYEQDGNGNNIIGNDNRGYLNEPAVDNSEAAEEIPEWR